MSLSEKFDVMLKTMDWQRQALTTKTPQLKSVRENLYVEKKKKSKDKELKKDHKKHKKDGKGRITLSKCSKNFPFVFYIYLISGIEKSSKVLIIVLLLYGVYHVRCRY